MRNKKALNWPSGTCIQLCNYQVLHATTDAWYVSRGSDAISTWELTRAAKGKESCDKSVERGRAREQSSFTCQTDLTHVIEGHYLALPTFCIPQGAVPKRGKNGFQGASCSTVTVNNVIGQFKPIWAAKLSKRERRLWSASFSCDIGEGCIRGINTQSHTYSFYPANGLLGFKPMIYIAHK